MNAIAPGWFPSDMSSFVLDAFGDTLTRRIPLDRFGGPDDLKGAVALPRRPTRARSSPGHTLVVDGGQSA